MKLPFHHAPAVSTDGGSTAVKDAFGVSAFPTYCMIAPDNTMAVNDMWPVSTVSTFEGFFPVALNPAACTFAGLNENGISELTLYPIPSSTEVNINFYSTTNSVAQIEVYNLLGEKVETILSDVIVGKNLVQVGLSNYSAGQYVISIKMDEIVETIKFSVVK